MAYLNVRERRLETRIAYVGAALSGRGTNLSRLGSDVPSSDSEKSRGVFWKPTLETMFRDCQVRVELVATRGKPTADDVRALLEDVDGVVFVADADPKAQSRNLASLTLVRNALKAHAKREVPVVVQVNKTDLPGARSAADVVAALDAVAWPHVAASALQGIGVLETAERALAAVLETLHRSPAMANDDAAANARSAAPTREGNPLLTALRQVLRETVTEEVDLLETRVRGTLERLFKGASTAVDEMRERAELFHASSTASSDALARSVRELSKELALHRTELTALRDRVAAVDARLESASNAAAQTKRAVDVVATHAAAIHTAVKPVVSIVPRLEQLEGAVRSDVREAVASLAARLEVVRDESSSALVVADAKTEAVGARVVELIEELKKPKKGWFA